MRGLALVALMFSLGCVSDERVPTANPDVELMRDWFRENLDDPHWDEVEIGNPVVGGNEKMYAFKIRTLVSGKGKTVQVHRFWIENGKITSHHLRH